MSNKDCDLTRAPVDPKKNRPAELDELDFSDDETESFIDLTPESEAADYDADPDRGPVENSDFAPAKPGQPPTMDDLAPEILIEENGARSPHEPGADTPLDRDLRVVGADEIGAGYGLDEAELARKESRDKQTTGENPR